MADTMRKNTDVGTRGGVARSSDEAFVMKVDQRGGWHIFQMAWASLRRGILNQMRACSMCDRVEF